LQCRILQFTFDLCNSVRWESNLPWTRASRRYIIFASTYFRARARVDSGLRHDPWPIPERLRTVERSDGRISTREFEAILSTKKARLKIAYLVNHYPKVSHTFIRREILALERQGFEVQRLALRGWDTPVPDEEDRAERDRSHYVLRNGAAALFLPLLRCMLKSPVRFFAAFALTMKMARAYRERPWIYHLAYLAEACVVLSWLKAFGARHVHAHFGTNSTEVVMLTHALGGPPYSFTVHGPDEFLQPMGLAEKTRRSAFVVAISSYGRSQLYLRLPHQDWPKVHVIHCGLDNAFYDMAPVPVPGTPRFVCVGRLSEEKGQLLLIEAVARVTAKNIPIELVLVGDGSLRGELENLVDKYRLRAQVRITGWISNKEVREEIVRARALVLPSFSEGLPVVIMEAMALRRPVLTTYIAGIPELVRSGENGWLFPAGSLDDLTNALEACLAMPVEDLQKLGDAGYGRVISRHSIDVEAGKLADSFRAANAETHGSLKKSI
jgi:colanic acid/amylovoran biosynthesis glycosyltransferase